jgi:hypothetical protein
LWHQVVGWSILGTGATDADVLQEVLQGFSGVLVSDFYGAYEAMECRQQKCLIHLMRDINELVLKYPFNSQLTDITSRFGTLLRNIVESIGRWGLKGGTFENTNEKQIIFCQKWRHWTVHLKQQRD